MKRRQRILQPSVLIPPLEANCSPRLFQRGEGRHRTPEHFVRNAGGKRFCVAQALGVRARLRVVLARRSFCVLATTNFCGKFATREIFRSCQRARGRARSPACQSDQVRDRESISPLVESVLCADLWRTGCPCCRATSGIKFQHGWSKNAPARL